MRCKQVRVILLDGLAIPGDPLPDGAAAHLAGCPACRRLQAELEASWAMLDSYPCPEASASFDQAVWARIRKTEAPAGRSRSRVPFFLARHAWVVGSLAAACLVIVIGVLLAVYGGAGKSPATSAARAAAAVPAVFPTAPRSAPTLPCQGAEPAAVVAEADEERLLEEIDELLGADPGSVADPAYIETSEEPGSRSRPASPAGVKDPPVSPRGSTPGVSGTSAARWAAGVCRHA